jgi:hypothetical protein
MILLLAFECYLFVGGARVREAARRDPQAPRRPGLTPWALHCSKQYDADFPNPL